MRGQEVEKRERRREKPAPFPESAFYTMTSIRPTRSIVIFSNFRVFTAAYTICVVVVIVA